MKIAIVRGDFLSDWEIPIFLPLTKNHDVTIFTGKKPVYNVPIPAQFNVERLFSPVDLNFGNISRIKMGILNRLFIDAHVLFGLEEKLKGFDIVYTAETFYYFTYQSILAKRKGYIKKVIMHVGENIPFNNEGIPGRRKLKQIALKETDKFIAITDTARDVLIKEGADPGKIIRADIGINLSFFKPKKTAEYKYLKKNNNIKLLVVSRLVEEKGISEIMDNFFLLKRKYDNIELVIVGTGPLKEELEAKAETSEFRNCIYFLGRVEYEKMVDIYNLCDIFVHYPKGSRTWIEQFGFVLTEAMGCGLPIVALDRGSIREVVKDGGLVVNEKEFPEALEKLIKNEKLRADVGLRALGVVRKYYDVAKYARKLEDVFIGALNKG